MAKDEKNVEVVKRLAPTKETLTRLFAKSGNLCAFPDCKHRLINDEGVFIAQVCHIEAADEGGERFNKNQSNEDRRKYDNLLLLCYEHHVVTNNVLRYPTEKLKEIKNNHETKYSAKDISKEIIDVIYNDLKSIREVAIRTSSNVKKNLALTEQILSILQNTKPSDDLKADKPDGFVEEIDRIVSTKNNNNKTTINLLMKLREEKWGELSNFAKYKVLANLGICYLEANEPDAAANKFIEAIEFDDSYKALSLVALGYGLTGNKQKSQEYIGKVLALDKLNLNAYIALIYNNQDKSFNELLLLIPDEIKEKTEIAYSLSKFASAKGDFHSAITWAQIALNNSANHKEEIKANLATNILQSVQDPYKILTGQLSTDAINKIRYCITLYDEAWAYLKNTEDRILNYWILINRGLAKKYLGDFNGAFEDIAEANGIHQDIYSLRHYAIAAMESNRLDKCREIIALMEIQPDVNLSEITLFKIDLARKEEKFDNVVELFNNLNIPDLDEKYIESGVQLMISVFVTQNDFDSAIKLCEDGIQKSPEKVFYYTQYAKIFLQKEDELKASEFLKKAYELINESTDFVDIQELANCYVLIGDFTKSIELYERITDLQIYSSLTKKLIQCYYRAGETKKILTTCDNLLKSYGPIGFVTEQKALVYEQINDLPNAIDVYLKHLAVYKDDQYIQLRLAFVQFKNGNIEEVNRLLDGIIDFDSTLSSTVRFQVANLARLIGKTDRALDLAYKTRREFFNEAQAHMGYIGVFMELRYEANELQEDEIKLNTVVRLKMSDEKITFFIIEDRLDALAERHEINLQNPITQKLVGKKRGDIIEMGGLNNGNKYVIVDVINKYIFAWQQSIEIIQTQFPETKGFQVYQTGNTGDIKKDMSFLFETIDQVEEFNSQVEKLYVEGKTTIGSTAEILKENVIKTWTRAVSKNDLGIFTIGLSGESTQAEELLSKGCGMMLDLISLLNLASINRLEILNRIDNPKAVAQSSINVISELILELKSTGPEGKLTIFKEGDNYIRNHITAEQVKAEIEKYEKLVKWCRDNCQVLPCNEAINYNASYKKEQDNILGECFVDSMLTSKEKGFIYFSEEANLRGLAANEHGIKSISAFLYFRYLHALNFATEIELYDFVINLFNLNYKLIPSDATLLYECAKHSKWQIKHPFTEAIKGLSGTYYHEDVAAIIAVDFFYKIYLDVSTELYSEGNYGLTRQSMVMSILSQLKNQYESRRISIKLLFAINIKFRLLIDQRDEIFLLVKNAFGIR